MSYNPYYSNGWLSGETGNTPITPEALNNMEQGIEDAHSLAENAGTAASTAQTTANSAKTTANAALPKAGGTMTGYLTTKGLKLTSGTDYGTSLPAAGNAGRVFFKKVSS